MSNEQNSEDTIDLTGLSWGLHCTCWVDEQGKIGEERKDTYFFASAMLFQRDLYDDYSRVVNLRPSSETSAQLGSSGDVHGPE